MPKILLPTQDFISHWGLDQFLDPPPVRLHPKEAAQPIREGMCIQKTATSFVGCGQRSFFGYKTHLVIGLGLVAKAGERLT